MSPTTVLGISGLYHDAAAALLVDGAVVAAVQEERLTRRKHDPALPVRAIEHCLRTGGIEAGGVDVVAYYERPVSALGRVLKSFSAAGIGGAKTFPQAMDQAVRRKLWAGYHLERALRDLGVGAPGRIVYAEHHVSHAAAAFYPSPFDRAAILTFDGVGEWATMSVGTGRGRRIDLLRELRFPASIGLLYTAFTVSAGFAANDGEYKLMGLAPFGAPTYRDRILDHLIDLRDDGSFTVDLRYFGYLDGRRMTTPRFDELFDGPPRDPGAPITRRECDLARSIQEVTEEIVLRVARHAAELTGERRVVLGGGVALNGVANGRLLREGPFEEVWVQPAPGDAGSALGCALWAWHEVCGEPRPDPDGRDAMRGALLGPRPLDALGQADPGAGADTGDRLGAWLAGRAIPHERIADPVARAAKVAALLAAGAVVAVADGPGEFGPRALGARSILADPRSATARSRLNLQVKRRESFRPFAPAVLADRVGDWFACDGPSPFMSFVVPVRGAVPVPAPPEGAPSEVVDLAARLDAIVSPLPAITHVDGSARLQTVDAERSPTLHAILRAFDAETGCPVLVNTSFNVRGEPIVSSAADAYECFLHTDIDWLLLEDALLERTAQPESRPVSAADDSSAPPP